MGREGLQQAYGTLIAAATWMVGFDMAETAIRIPRVGRPGGYETNETNAMAWKLDW